jgi:ADP-heptose:LPS heptosyltransferase
MKKFEIFLKNILLKLLVTFNPVQKNIPLPQFDSTSNLLFIRLNRLGDALVTTPLLHEVKEQLKCKVYVLADRKNHFIFKNNPSVDEVFIFEKGLTGFKNFNSFLKQKSIDAVIDTHDDVSTTVSFLVALAMVKFKFALKKSNKSLFTHTIERIDPKSNHIILRLLKLLELFNLKVSANSARVRYYPSQEIISKASVELKKMNPENKFSVGINISAGSKARFWGVDNFKLLINLLSNYNVKPILFCTQEDLPLARDIAKESFIYPFTKGFDIFAAAVLNIDFLFTPDTSIVQIASINKIPLFGIYVKYKTDDMLWTPFNTDFECIVTEEPTLKNVSFDEVKNKLLPFLEKHLNAKQHSIL